MRLRRLLATLPVLLLAALPASAASPHTRYDGGGNSDFKVTLIRHGHTLAYDVSFQAPCTTPGVMESPGYGSGQPPAWKPLRLSRSGRFADHRRVTSDESSFDVDFNGRIGRHSASGTYRATITAFQVPGDTCTTGLVHWTARPGGVGAIPAGL
jgi:hypothetical protein